MKRLLYILVVLIILGGLSSCRTQYIPVETIKTEYRTRDSIRHDSIYQQDSVYVTVKGDTVYEYKYKYLYKYQYINRTDTLMNTDSIQIPFPVEKQLSKWQSFKLDFGGAAMLVLIMIVIVKLKNLKM
ncbi:hypothetical protein [Bacteroides sp. GM023]|uniref:hypothetical protein n=1 Tax=Bacteroides sp. GM023 TaxID=2723058 RepID=UPI00168AEE67|nr:hypothetical protein [Bacteroides sp. GM023]MBD3591498.1 hypothetical protein [Bacteroides sp. GM023]